MELCLPGVVRAGQVALDLVERRRLLTRPRADRRVALAARGQQLVALGDRHGAEHLVVDLHDRGAVTDAEALRVLDGDLGLRVVVTAERLDVVLVDLLPTLLLAGGVRADAQQPVADRLALVHRVERRDRADLGARQADLLGAERDALVGDVVLDALHQVQQRQQRRARHRVAAHDAVGRLVDLLVQRRQLGGLGRLGIAHRSTPPITGSSEATTTMTSETDWSRLITSAACRLTKLGSRTWTRYGRFVPVEVIW